MRVLILLGLFAYAAAQTTSSGMTIDQAFQMLDTNTDNALSKDEIKAYLERYDSDKDCDITFHEYSSQADAADRHSPQVVGTFNYYDKLDGNQNMHITCSVIDVIYNRLDANSDGNVSKHEFLTNFPAIEAEIQQSVASAGTAPVGK